MNDTIKWLSIKEVKPTEGKYYLICSDMGWLGIQKYENGLWCCTEFPNVICDNIVYDVYNHEILYFAEIDEIPRPKKYQELKKA